MSRLMPVRHFYPAIIFQTLFAVVFAIIFLMGPWQIAVAEENSDSPGLTKAPELFINPNVQEDQSLGIQSRGIQKRNKAALRQRSVRVDREVLKNKLIRLNLFDGAEFVAERKHMKEGLEGETTWSGQLIGSIHGTAHITVLGDSAAGSIATEDGQLFEINAAPGGQIMIEEIDLDKLPPHVNPRSPEDAPFTEELSGDARTENAPATSANNGAIIDIMVVYTQGSRNRYGASGIQSKIINAVDAMNIANANSLVNARFRLVYSGEVDYVESGDMGVALDRVTGKTDGYMDNVHALRDQFKADIVSLIVEDSNACGIAWVMTPSQLSNRMERLAFNVVYSGCLSNHTLTHEVGHNEGCVHDRANSDFGGSYEYSYGHRDTVTGFRTIMSYSCNGGACPQIPHFSNPNVNHNGAPTGIDHNVDPNNSTDNVRSLNNNEAIIANWRQAVESTVPLAPSSLVAVALSEERIDVSWTDNADNEEGVYLERSPNGVDTWAVIATLTANTTSHSDNGLIGNTTYYYRARAYNGAGNSVYSNTDSAVTVSNAPSSMEVINARAKLKPDINDDLFKVKGIFTLDIGSDGIDPVNESFFLTLGTFSETISPGSFVRKKNGWIYKAQKTKPFSGIKKIVFKDNGKFKIIMKGIDLSGTDFSSPVLFSIQIANDQAELMIPFDNSKPNKKSYKR